MTTRIAPRCALCDAPAELSTASLDPRWPLGFCSGRHSGSGLVPLVDTQERRLDLEQQRRAIAVRERHRAHVADRGHLVPTCPYCAELISGRVARLA